MAERFHDRESPAERINPEATLGIDNLPQKLGFYETEELARLHAELVWAISSGDQREISVISLQYRLKAEEIINQLQGDDFARGQLGLNIAMAMIRREGGRLDAYREDLDDALDQCYGLGYEDIAQTIVLEKIMN